MPTILKACLTLCFCGLMQGFVMACGAIQKEHYDPPLKVLDVRSQEVRYAVIQTLLNRYKRPFTMVDVGAGNGYYSLRAARDYKDSVFVMVEGDEQERPFLGTQLQSICTCNEDLHNIIFLNRAVTALDLQRLGECEHFDVVLALDVVNRVGQNWRNIVDTIVNLGEQIIIETNKREVKDDLECRGAVMLGCSNSHSQSWLFWLSRKKEYLKRKSWLSDDAFSCYIESTYTEKKLIKTVPIGSSTTVTSHWLPGINLVTFKMYAGSYPSSIELKNAVDSIKDIFHSDWRPHNMIVQGDHIAMIDYDDPRRLGKQTNFSLKRAYLLKLINKWIAIMNPENVESFYLHKLI